jgi:hypothetical protein
MVFLWVSSVVSVISVVNLNVVGRHHVHAFISCIRKTIVVRAATKAIPYVFNNIIISG